MSDATYTALADCARRRIEQEWDCSGTERELLRLITYLSFDLGQTWALIPCLADFAAILGVHKSTVSRALRSVRKKGYLLVLMRREETLYSICTETRGTAAETRGTAAETRSRLVEMNKNRLQGKADADGQQRLPGILPSEETAAPAAAFAAMVEESERATIQPPDATNHVPRETTLPATTRAAADDGTDEAFQRRLERMVTTMESQRGDAPAESLPRNTDRFDEEMERLCRGLKGEPLHAMERLREEFQSAGKLQEAVLFKWGRVWRKRCLQQTRPLLEACGEHKNLRLTTGKGADEPGAWIYAAIRDGVHDTS